VNPDRLVAVDVEGNGKKAKPLAQAADVLLVANRLIHEVRGDDHDDDQRDQAVSQVHGRRIL
jgi:hypothetical protein